MSQLNIHMTPDFEKDLRKLMKLRQFKTKAEAIRTALKECLQQTSKKPIQSDFKKWLGLALQAPINENPKFQDDNDLWNADNLSNKRK